MGAQMAQWSGRPVYRGFAAQVQFHPVVLCGMSSPLSLSPPISVSPAAVLLIKAQKPLKNA